MCWRHHATNSAPPASVFSGFTLVLDGYFFPAAFLTEFVQQLCRVFTEVPGRRRPSNVVVGHSAVSLSSVLDRPTGPASVRRVSYPLDAYFVHQYLVDLVTWRAESRHVERARVAPFTNTFRRQALRVPGVPAKQHDGISARRMSPRARDDQRAPCGWVQDGPERSPGRICGGIYVVTS
ncbi:hypothetical protein PYCCODRAFT_523253 [Trametes coccinea BRFM310]|uniref:Uncharacterized protein n=1 Tax=Trametes coccinea (strain BRFM310) TaxID=1353009 RepID=A0A1Y2IML0_TRAC3|nr:hypothetical protein PYCCODRAFT_523253 [Trametes coccinea BRFM310]